MPWVYFDDQFTIHRKVTRLSDAAFRLHVSAIFWCARNLTDGVVPEEDLDDVTAQVRTPTRFVPELVKRGLWHEAGQECPSELCPAPATDGWVIHDYLEINPSKQKVVKRRKENAERQRRYRERQTERGSGNDAVSNASRNALLTRSQSRPSPEGTRDGTSSQSSSRRNPRASGPDDDASIDLAIVQLLAELTGRDIPLQWASEARQRILTGRNVRKRMAYVLTSIQERPEDFLPPTADPDPSPSPSLKVVPEWCGHCHADNYRWLELADGRWAKCPACNPDASKEAS